MHLAERAFNAYFLEVVQRTGARTEELSAWFGEDLHLPKYWFCANTEKIKFK
jgi:hypothetical protein